MHTRRAALTFAPTIFAFPLPVSSSRAPALEVDVRARRHLRRQHRRIRLVFLLTLQGGSALSPRGKDLWVASQMEGRGEEWWRQQQYRTRREQHRQFDRRQLRQQQQQQQRQFRQRLRTILHPDRVSCWDKGSLGKSRSHLPSFMTKRIIRPRLSAPAAVVYDPSASALTDVSPSDGDRDNQSNLINKATMPREAEEDGAVGLRPEWKLPAAKVRHRRRASYRGKRRRRLDTDID